MSQCWARSKILKWVHPVFVCMRDPKTKNYRGRWCQGHYSQPNVHKFQRLGKLSTAVPIVLVWGSEISHNKHNPDRALYSILWHVRGTLVPVCVLTFIRNHDYMPRFSDMKFRIFWAIHLPFCLEVGIQLCAVWPHIFCTTVSTACSTTGWKKNKLISSSKSSQQH